MVFEMGYAAALCRRIPGGASLQPIADAGVYRCALLAIAARGLIVLVEQVLDAQAQIDTRVHAQAAQEEDKRRYDERLIQVERLATLGRMAAEVAHRIKGPLTTIAVNAEVAAHRLRDDAHSVGELAQITEEVQRCKDILKNLLDLGRIEEMDREPLDLRVSAERASKRVAAQAAERELTLRQAGFDAPLPTMGDESLIQEALYALLQNAVEAAKPGGTIRLEASTYGGRHRLSVSDDGVGVVQGDLEKIFQPFFKTKPEGSGLGLSAALLIAQKHGGSVEVHSDGIGRGARFVLSLPAGR